MRERRGVAAVAVALALAAGACGSDDTSGIDTTAATAATSTAGTSTAAPTSGPTATGVPATDDATTDGAATDDPAVPSAPAASGTSATAATAVPSSADASPVGERLVLLAEEPVLADVLALGFHPIASTASVPEVGFQGIDPAATAGIEILPMTTLDLEQVAVLQPDTIITLQFWADQVGADVLRALGDLILIPDGLTVTERITTLGELLDRPAEAATLVAELEAATQRADAAVPDDCTVSLAAIYPGPSPAVFVDGPWDQPTAIQSTGCRLDPDPSVVTPDGNGRVYLSLEQLGLLDAPTIVLLQSGTVEGESDALAQIESNPLWARLPAVRSGNVVTFDRLGYPGLAGQIRFLDDVASALGS